MKNKRAIATEYLPWLLIAIAMLAIILIAIWSMKSGGFSIIDKIKGLFRG